MFVTMGQGDHVLHHNPILQAIHMSDIKSFDAMSDFSSCVSGGTTYTDSSHEEECWNGCYSPALPQSSSNPDFSFWILPPELRTMVYRELLLSDSAFRLGHHGPYSHESRRDLFPQILRTCQTIFLEASEVLYGDNTFYLGPIGHKPTYSASFITSIGSHNAVKIRTLVAHCTHISSLSDRYLRSWITSFGLNVDRIKVLAVSFSPSITGETLTRAPFSPSSIFHPQLPPALPPQNMSTFTPFLGAPGGAFGLLANVVLPGSGPTPLPTTAVVGSSPVVTPSTEREEAERLQLEYALMESRMQTWLTRSTKNVVTTWVQVKNTDLRAGDRWLLYVCPTVQAMKSLRF